MATHPSIFARKPPWTEESGGLQSIGCKESDTTEHAHTHFFFKHASPTWNQKRESGLSPSKKSHKICPVSLVLPLLFSV